MKKFLLIFVCCICLCGCDFDDGMKQLGFEKEETKFDNGSLLTLTKLKYDKIEIDMSYSEVTSILDGNCEMQYESSTNNEKYESYLCWDKDDSSKRIVINFSNDKLISKSQMGL